MMRTREDALKRARSTCHSFTVHGAHDWDQGDSKLWCPGTDDSNPQVPAALGKMLREGLK